MPKPKRTSDILKRRSKKEKSGIARFFVRLVIWGSVSIIVVGGLGLVGAYFFLSESLPKISSLTDYHPSVITEVYSEDHKKIAEMILTSSISEALKSAEAKGE